MVWSRFLDVIILVNNRRGSPVVTSLTNQTPIDAVEVISHDTFPLRLRFVESTGSSNDPLRPVRLPAGAEIVLGGKKLSDLGANDLLYLATDFSEVQDGEEDTYYYEAVLNTNTEQVTDAIDALAGNSRVLQTLADVEIQTDDNSQRTTFQILINVKRQVYSGGEGGPADANPPWPSPADLLTKTERFRIGATGDPEWYVTALEAWVRVTFAGSPPEMTVTALD